MAKQPVWLWVSLCASPSSANDSAPGAQLGAAAAEPARGVERRVHLDGTRDPSALLAIPASIQFLQSVGLETFRSRTRGWLAMPASNWRRCTTAGPWCQTMASGTRRWPMRRCRLVTHRRCSRPFGTATGSRCPSSRGTMPATSASRATCTPHSATSTTWCDRSGNCFGKNGGEWSGSESDFDTATTADGFGLLLAQHDGVPRRSAARKVGGWPRSTESSTSLISI